MTDYEIGDEVTPCPDGQLWNNKIRECQDEEDWNQFMEDRWSSDDVNEVNTSYDQNQPIGDEPQALNTELSNSEPIDAETGQDFLDIQYGGQSKKIGEFQTVWKQLGYESLNLDGTGVARATRGVNPNKTVNKIIRFIYVSKSDCPICKQYDGHSWEIDSPNRPVIPRLEKGNKSRPFTHPHCKCKWVNVFSDQEVISSEVNQADFDRTRKWYGHGFDDLTRIQQKMAMIDMFKQSLGMEADAEEDILDPIPLASMAQMAFDTIKPMIKHKLGIGEAFLGQPHAKQHNYGIQSMLDDIVTKSLDKDEKKEIEESTELENDFSLDTLLGLIADRLSKKIGKKLGVESKAKEGGRGSGRVGHQKWMLAGEVGEECPNCMMITEREDGKCTICGK